MAQALEHYEVPYFMAGAQVSRLFAQQVRTKVDLDVWNNRQDNEQEEAETLRLIREELQGHVKRVYLVSSRDPDRHDMPMLLADAFPGVRKFLDASSFLFTGAAPSDGWGDAWAMPVVWSSMIAGLQGQWRDALNDLPLVVPPWPSYHGLYNNGGQWGFLWIINH